MLGWTGANQIIGTIGQLFSSLLMGGNSLLGRPTNGVGVPSEIAISTNELVARAGGDLGPLPFAAQSVLIRGSGNITAQAVATNEILGRQGGDLGLISVPVQTVLLRGGANLSPTAIGTNEIVGRAGGNLGAVAVASNSVVGRLGADLAAIPVASTATINSVALRDAAGRLKAVAGAANGDVAVYDQLSSVNCVVATAILQLQTNPAGAETVVIGADTYIWNGGGAKDPAVGGTQAISAANLVSKINTNGTQLLFADVVTVGANQAVRIRSANAVGGTPEGASPSILLNETMVGVGNLWLNGNVNMNTLGGEAQAFGKIQHSSHTVSAAEVAAGVFPIDSFEFTVQHFNLQVLRNGVFVGNLTDTFTILGSSTILWTSVGGIHLQANDVITIVAYQ